jgi:hypothetical protein
MTAQESYLSKALISGTVCAIVAAFLNPFDVVKIRIQNNSPSHPWPERRMLLGLIKLWEVEGIVGWTRGINASILRELFYSSIRIGAYEPILHFLHSDQETIASPMVKYLSGLFSGGIGSALANPTDLVKVNFQAYIPGGHSPPLPYSSTLGAFRYLHRQGGIKGMYKGWAITSARSAILTSAQIGSYDTIKNNILKQHFHLKDGYGLHFVASMLAGLITTTAANPSELPPPFSLSLPFSVSISISACLSVSVSLCGSLSVSLCLAPSPSLSLLAS